MTSEPFCCWNVTQFCLILTFQISLSIFPTAKSLQGCFYTWLFTYTHTHKRTHACAHTHKLEEKDKTGILKSLNRVGFALVYDVFK